MQPSGYARPHNEHKEEQDCKYGQEKQVIAFALFEGFAQIFHPFLQCKPSGLHGIFLQMKAF